MLFVAAVSLFFVMRVVSLWCLCVHCVGLRFCLCDCLCGWFCKFVFLCLLFVMLFSCVFFVAMMLPV